MANITEKEYKSFSEQLAQKFELNIKGNQISVSLPESFHGVKLIPKPTAKDVKEVKWKSIKENEIYFYSKNKSNDLFNLLRHFRNCASHKDCIIRKKIKGKLFYRFEDKNKAYVSLRGIVREDMWNSFIDDLYEIGMNNIRTGKNETKSDN